MNSGADLDNEPRGNFLMRPHHSLLLQGRNFGKMLERETKPVGSNSRASCRDQTRRRSWPLPSGRWRSLFVEFGDLFFAQASSAGDLLADVAHPRFGGTVCSQHFLMQGGILLLAVLVEIEKLLTLPVCQCDQRFEPPIVAVVIRGWGKQVLRERLILH